MKTLMTARSVAVVAGSVVGAMAPLAQAQTVWTGTGTNWNLAANWTAGVPSSAISAQLNGGPIAQFTGDGSTLDLSITSAAAGLGVTSGVTFGVHGTSVSNQGTITINPSGGSFDAAMVFFNAATTLSGTGSIVLNPVGNGVGTDAGITSSVATNVVTQAAGHTIRGNGYILVSINNAGVITGDIPARGLGFGVNPQSNSGLIVAQNGGFIDINGIALTQTGGVLRATGAGSIAEAHGSIIGGTWEGVAGGLARTGGTLTLDAVTTNGEVHIISGNAVAVLTSLTNTGTLTINPSGGASDASISFNSPASAITGGGTIVLNPVGGGIGVDAGIVSSVPGNVVTNSAGSTIRGNGYILANVANAGLIAADIPGRAIGLASNPKSNSGLIVAQNGGLLDFSSVVVTQSGSGVIRATGAGSVAEFGGGVSSLTGGTWEGVSGGLARTGGTLTLDSVTCNGTVDVVSGHTVAVLNAFTNTGTITINPSGGSSDAAISINSPAITLVGGGTIVLNPVGGGFEADAGIVSLAPANVLTNPAGATIRGNGYLNVNINNQGLIAGDIAARGLVLGINPKSNSGQILAQNGGSVDIENITLTQTGGGIVRAIGAGSIAEAHGAIIGGGFGSTAGGLARTGGPLSTTDVTFEGTLHVLTGHTLTAQGGFTNNAAITINPTGGSSNASLTVSGAALTFAGTGSITMNGVGSTNDANIFAGVGTTITNGAGHTLAGNGDIIAKLDNAGTLSPGQAAPGDQTQALVRAATYADVTCLPSSVIKIDIEGSAAGQFDRLTHGSNQADFVCGGTLDIAHINGFTGAPVGTTFDIITAAAPATITGEFATVNQPTFPSGDRYVIEYFSNAVRLRVACYADADGDGSLSIDDFIVFQTLFAIGDPTADCDLDGQLIIDDFICYQTLFAIGC